MIPALLALALSAAAPGPQATDDAARRAAWERGQAEDRAFRRERFANAGFDPVAEPEPRERRQLLLSDPYGMIPVPGIELARDGAGKVTLTVQHRGWREPPVAVAAAEWDRLAALEPSVFVERRYAPPPARSGPPQPPPSPPPICHGWSANLAADGKAPVGWAECGSGAGPSPAGQYALHMVGIAMRTRPACGQADGGTLWAFQRCFASFATLDDPALQARYATLSRDYAALDLAEPLAAARRALGVPGMTLGSPAWQAAREAVERYRQLLENRRRQLTWMRQLGYQSNAISAADRARIRHTADSWQDFTDSQDANTVDLLARLTAAPR